MSERRLGKVRVSFDMMEHMLRNHSEEYVKLEVIGVVGSLPGFQDFTVIIRHHSLMPLLEGMEIPFITLDDISGQEEDG